CSSSILLADPPKKSRGKGSQRKKTADDSQETVDVSKKSKPEPKSVRLLLGKSINQTEAEEAKATMGGNDAEAGSSRSKRSRQFETVEEVLLPQIRAFNIKEPIYAELCHEFHSTYEFDEVCADDELQSKKIIKFRLGGRAYNLTLLEFARRLGLYHADELEEDGFDVYFQGGLRSDEHFNAQEYWLSISREENLGLSMRHNSTIRSLILRVIHKMITYGLCQRTTRFGYDYTERALSTSEGRLILRSQPGVPDWEAIERMEYRQSYHWDTYQGVFEHMVRVYSVPLQGAYNPPGYAQP
ncbi:hypothetical protein Tco_0547905, partial [Tanacetum coccineum]